MDAYVNYVRALAARGYTTQAIQDDLLARGMDRQTIAWLIEAMGAAPGAVIAPGANAEATPLPSFTNTLPQPAVQTQAAATAPAQGQAQAAPPAQGQAPAVAAPAQASLVQRATTQSPSAVVDGAPTGIAKGYIATAALCLLPSLLILFSLRLNTGTRMLLAFGDIAGVVGLVLYAADLVLSTRLSWLEDWFGGLNKVYVAHALFGGLSLMFILLHALLLGVRYSPLGWHSVGDFFLPSLQHVPTIYGIVALDMMLVLLIVTFYARLPYRIWLWTHKLLGLAYCFIALHVLFSPNAITGNLLMNWYLVLVTLGGAAAFVYRTLLPNVLVRHYTYVIKSVQRRGTGVEEITLVPANEAMPYKAGQFIFISFEADGLSPEWHPFSITSPPSDGSLSIDVKSQGSYTETITRLLPNMVGMSVRVEGAYGRFSSHGTHNANQVWVAGGIGITPFLSMAQALGNGPYNIDLYYSVRSEGELIDIDVLARQQSSRPGQVFRVMPFVTEKYSRHLSADMIAATSGDLKGRDFLLCGPAAMMDSLRQQLIAAGVSKYRIHSEDFSIR
ncbi:MAG TPA: ferric reductase-like transmembrane domain-containing protein [Candidatus Saccharimonadales bacterium]|jgi:predicted ferric reductase